MSADDAVRVIGPEPSGFAEMLGAIVRANLQRSPDRVALLDGKPGVVRITAADADVTVSLEFRDGGLRIYSGAVSAPADVEIISDAETLTTFSSVPQLGPIPHPLRAEGRAALRKAFRGEIKIRGAAKGQKLLKRMRVLLSMDTG